MLLQGGENVAKKQTDGSLALEQQRVIVIPAHDEIVARKIRVAAYARVSSSSEDQLNSYRVQNQYYSELISSNPDWEMVDIYADEGITGTSVEKREDFQRMMQDCRKGKIDRILVKSISRFARNTKDCLAAVRELKELGVSVQFEEQGIDTSKVSSEMVTAIMASLAQKQSESISGNTRMGIQWRMESGHFHISNPPLGYNLEEGVLSATEDGISVVKFIFDSYLSGKNSREISEKLNSQQALNRTWTSKTVDYVLQNERYAGNALLQKRYTTDSFPRVKKRNRGERMQYYIADSNEAIITQEQFDRAQALRKTEKRSSQKISVHIQKGASVPVAPDAAPSISIKFGTGFVLRMRNKKVSAQSSRYRRKLLTQRSAVCTTNSRTTAIPSSRRCSRTSKKSVIAGCSGART